MNRRERVLKYDDTKKMILLDVKNHLTIVDKLELLLPEDTVPIDAATMIDLNNNKITAAHGGNQIYLSLEIKAPIGALVRKKIY